MLRGCGKLRGSTSYKVRFSTSSQPDKHLYVPVSVCELPPGQSLSTIPCRRVPGKICHKHVHRTLLRKISVDIQTFFWERIAPSNIPFLDNSLEISAPKKFTLSPRQFIPQTNPCGEFPQTFFPVRFTPSASWGPEPMGCLLYKICSPMLPFDHVSTGTIADSVL